MEAKKSGHENHVIMSGEDQPQPLRHTEFVKDEHMALTFEMVNGRLHGKWKIENGQKGLKRIPVHNESPKTLIVRDFYLGIYGNLLFKILPFGTIKIQRTVFFDELLKLRMPYQEIHVTIVEDKPWVGQPQNSYLYGSTERMLNFFRPFCRNAEVYTVGAPAADACQACQNGMTQRPGNHRSYPQMSRRHNTKYL